MSKKDSPKRFDYDRYLLLNIKKTALFMAAWVLAVILHNVVYAVLNHFFPPAPDEPFFFFLAVVVIPLYFLFALLYTIVRKSLTNLPFGKK